MSIETVAILVTDDNPSSDPVEGVVVRVFDASGTNFITSTLTDNAGRADVSLVAPLDYQLRFFKDRFSIRQPVLISVLEAPVAPVTNEFEIEGHVFKPPEATHPRLCRASGFFKRPDGSVAVGHDINIIAKFDPLLFDGAAMLTERLAQRTDQSGFMQIDLVRFGQYEVVVEGFEDCLRIITIPDAASVNLPDLLFPVVSRIAFSPAGPWSVAVGPENDFEITPTVFTSDGRTLPGTALRDVLWSVADPTVAAVLATNDKLFLRGLVIGTTELRAVRADSSIIRIPNPPIEGVPVALTVV